MVDEKHFGVEDALLHTPIRTLVIELALQGREDGLEEEAEVEEKHGLVIGPRCFLEATRARKEQEVAKDVVGALAVDIRWAKDIATALCEDSEEIVSLHVALSVNRQFEHALPNRVVRIINAAKEAKIERRCQRLARPIVEHGEALERAGRADKRRLTLLNDFFLDALVAKAPLPLLLVDSHCQIGVVPAVFVVQLSQASVVLPLRLQCVRAPSIIYFS